jgi:hypothetical protein
MPMRRRLSAELEARVTLRSVRGARTTARSRIGTSVDKFESSSLPLDNLPEQPEGQ